MILNYWNNSPTSNSLCIFESEQDNDQLYFMHTVHYTFSRGKYPLVAWQLQPCKKICIE